MNWQLEKAPANSEEGIARLLENGWEPFAVSVVYDTETIYFRRKVGLRSYREENINEGK